MQINLPSTFVNFLSIADTAIVNRQLIQVNVAQKNRLIQDNLQKKKRLL